jgi:hypothetical protein
MAARERREGLAMLAAQRHARTRSGISSREKRARDAADSFTRTMVHSSFRMTHAAARP